MKVYPVQTGVANVITVPPGTYSLTGSDRFPPGRKYCMALVLICQFAEYVLSPVDPNCIISGSPDTPVMPVPDHPRKKELV